MTLKISSSLAVALIVVVLSWNTHLCHAAFPTNETFPLVDAMQRTSIKESNLRVSSNHRREQVVGDVISGVRNFKPLSCNSAILKAGSVCSGTWSGMFGTSATHTNKIVIPCGVCVTMNHASGTLNLNGGIDIQGKLILPDNGLSINITTTSIVVQGELIMTSTSPITGIPKIKVTLVGSNEATFTPIDVNAKACNGATTCIAGKKSFVVAGGKVTLNGAPTFTPTWTRLYNALGGTFNNPDTIVVPSSTVNKWNVGAQVVITSHTHGWTEHQVRTIVQRVNGQQQGYTGWKLNATFIRPTTLLESKDFAVEVALLSRNILFEGGPDTNSRHGGHFIVYHTPAVTQKINGVEFRNFGQQGTLGRYPIHFHHCGDVSGSIVSKNSIHQSKQRCISAHGTNKLKIQENVAFDTKGHCYLTEDGTETGNEFIMNIGIMTDSVDVLIPKNSAANNGAESDDEAAAFWITNPSNVWIGNVAAGAYNSGFWFDPQLRGPLAGRKDLYPGDTKAKKGYHADRVPLTMFKGNVAHSISTIRSPADQFNSYAFRMYTPGYLPSLPTVFDGVKAYKNAIGINIHACHKIHLTNSLFADNFMGVDLERSEDLTVSNSIIIGESPSYRQLMARQDVRQVCLRGRMTGIQLGTWQNKYGPGYRISNVTFSGFKDALCARSAAVNYDAISVKQGIFETISTFDRIQLPEGQPLIDMCLIESSTFEMLYINDLKSSLRPASMNVASTVSSTLIASDNNELLKFVQPSKCVSVPAGCYSYCRDTCFRTVRVQIPAQSSWKLKLCAQGVTPAACVLYKLGRRGGLDDYTAMVHAPVGQSYSASIVDSLGKTVVPKSQIVYYEENHCGTGRFQFSLANYVDPISFTPWSDFTY